MLTNQALLGALALFAIAASLASGLGDCEFSCTADVKPVCGSDGKTYSNICQLNTEACKQKKTISVANRGECGKVDPLCASLTCNNGAFCVVADGKASCQCPPKCPEMERPICGSDGKTYPNTCVMKMNACKSNQEVWLKSEGAC